MKFLLGLILLFFSMPIFAQNQKGKFIEIDNVSMAVGEKILPMHNYNYPKEEYHPYGTKALVDTLEFNGGQYVFFALGLKLSEGAEYRSFFNLVVKLRDSESFLALAEKKRLFLGITSRNHPDYIGQGVFVRDEYSIDFIAFTRKNNETAIVNNKLFDLSNGKVIIIRETDKYKYLIHDSQVLVNENIPFKNLKIKLKELLQQESEKALK